MHIGCLIVKTTHPHAHFSPYPRVAFSSEPLIEFYKSTCNQYNYDVKVTYPIWKHHESNVLWLPTKNSVYALHDWWYHRIMQLPACLSVWSCNQGWLWWLLILSRASRWWWQWSSLLLDDGCEQVGEQEGKEGYNREKGFVRNEDIEKLRD